MRFILAVLLFGLLLAISWPIALLLLVLFPLIWLILLPFRIIGFTLELMFKLVAAIILFPFRILKLV